MATVTICRDFGTPQNKVCHCFPICQEFPGGLLRLDPAFAYAKPPSSWPLPWAEFLTLAPGTHLFAMKWWPDAMMLVFWKLSFKPTYSLSSFIFIKRLFSSSLLSTMRVVLSAHLRLLIFLPAILIPACASSSPAFPMMFSAYRLNKQGDNIQPWHTPFPIWI